MLSSLKLSLQAVSALTIFHLMLLLQSSLSMSVFSDLRTYDQTNDLPATLENILNPQLEKREHGSDPWNICPYGMSQVACFDKYLEVYSRMRKMADSNHIRQLIGKRSADSPEPCPVNDLCIEI